MGHHCLRVLRFAILLGLAAGLAAGCQKSGTPSKGPTPDVDGGPDADGQLGGKPAGEDPEVAAYFEKKGWRLVRDTRFSDYQTLIYLWVEGRDNPYDELALTADDYRMIARSKTSPRIRSRFAARVRVDNSIAIGFVSGASLILV